MQEKPELDPVALPVARQTSPVWLPLTVIALAAGASFLAILYVRSGRPASTPEPDLAAEARADLDRRNFRPLSGPLEALLTDASYKPVPTQAHPQLGLAAPDFTLNDTDGRAWTLSEKLRNGPVVLVFYYGYHCNHCVSQLFGLTKDIEKFRELGAQVVAVSADPPELTRERFKKYGPFAFPVVSDPANQVAQKYATFTPGLKPGDEGSLAHGTFVIGRSGRLAWANRGEEPFTENRTLLVEIHRRERAENSR
ncbi:MAG: peroxiredoxin family protein [Gemmataceae bacterium]